MSIAFYGVSVKLGKKIERYGNSLYKISVNSKAEPIVQKLVLNDNKPKVDFTYITRGTIGISFYRGIVGYETDRKERCDEVLIGALAGRSSPLSALFLSRREAIRCYQDQKLFPWDERFLKLTMEVLMKIGHKRQLPIMLDSMLARAVKSQSSSPKKDILLSLLLSADRH